jgi:hypothetical protein
MLSRLLLLGITALTLPALAASANNVILVTVDGVRWQEVFRGADATLLADQRFTPKDYNSFTAHQTAGAEKARAQLMPFFWEVVAARGSVLGDRDHGSTMRVTNPWWFSYPGYNEILTGRVDPAIDSNAKRPNPNVTVLEWLNAQAAFKGRVQAFGSWDAFPYIINAERSGVPVHWVGSTVVGAPTREEQYLARLQQQMPLAFPTVQHDAFTHNYALEAMRTDRPRVLYVAYGEPDDFAHVGKYGEYLSATHRFDAYLRELWETAQANRFYRNRTVLLVTTDHGRGETPIETWQHHSSQRAVQGYSRSLAQYEQGIVGSDQIWFAALGPGIAARGVISTNGEREQVQIAATLLAALGLSREEFNPSAAAPLTEVLEAPSLPSPRKAGDGSGGGCLALVRC